MVQSEHTRAHTHRELKESHGMQGGGGTKRKLEIADDEDDDPGGLFFRFLFSSIDMNGMMTDVKNVFC
jgi:hypothetical protein